MGSKSFLATSREERGEEEKKKKKKGQLLTPRNVAGLHIFTYRMGPCDVQRTLDGASRILHRLLSCQWKIQLRLVSLNPQPHTETYFSVKGNCKGWGFTRRSSVISDRIKR